MQTAEGELEIEIPQVREAAEPFVSSLFSGARKLVATEPLRALVIGAFVRGLSMRDVESLCEKAGLGKVAKSTAQRICTELRERFEQLGRRDLYAIRLVALFLDATFLAVRRDGPKEGVLLAWGFTEEGERVLLSVMLGMRESFEDWQALGRDLIARGLGAPMLIVADGAPGLIKAIEQCWPASDRQRCCVHRAGAKPVAQPRVVVAQPALRVGPALVASTTQPGVELVLHRALDDQPRPELGELRQRLPRVLADPHGEQLVDLLLDLRRRRYGTSHGVGPPSIVFCGT